MEEHISGPAAKDPSDLENLSEKSQDGTARKFSGQSEIEYSVETCTDEENKASPGKELEHEEVEIESSSSIIEGESSEASTCETSHKNATMSDRRESDCSSTLLSPFRDAKYDMENLKTSSVPEKEIDNNSCNIKIECKYTDAPKVELTGTDDGKSIAFAESKRTECKTVETKIFSSVAKESDEDKTSKPTICQVASDVDVTCKSVSLDVEDINVPKSGIEIEHLPNALLVETSLDINAISIESTEEYYTDNQAKALEKTLDTSVDIEVSETGPSLLNQDIVFEGEVRHIRPLLKEIDRIRDNLPETSVMMPLLTDTDNQAKALEKKLDTSVDIEVSETRPSLLNQDIVFEGEVRHTRPPLKEIDRIRDNLPETSVMMPLLADAEAQTEDTILDLLGEEQSPEDSPEAAVDTSQESVTENLQVDSSDNELQNDNSWTIREKIFMALVLILVFILICLVAKLLYDTILQIMKG